MFNQRRVPKETGIFLILIGIIIVLGLVAPAFLTVSNVFNVLLNSTTIALLALGETFVLLTAGIDLSVGAVLALSGVVAAEAFGAHLPWELATLLGILSGSAIGLFNGIVIHFTKVPPFIATFASLGIASSIPLILTSAVPIGIQNNVFQDIGQGFLFGVVPIAVLILLLMAVILHLGLTMSRFGIHVYATGGNREAARLAGINLAKMDIAVYTISGTLAGLGGIVLASRLGSGYPTAGSGTSLFEAISAAVVGGVSLFGGVGTIPGALIGAVIIGSLADGMNILNVNSYWQPLVIGLVILIAVTIDTIRTSRRRSVRITKVVADVMKPAESSRETMNAK